ncbi:S8 family serine peptidase [Bacillus sp. FSL W7-1360]
MNLFPYQWNMNKVTGGGKSYVASSCSSQVKVALIDSGIDVNHPDLQHAVSVEESRSFIGQVEDFQDNVGHGTMVAGIIAANGVLKGVAPHASLVACKITNTTEFVVEKVIAAIEHAVMMQVDVINLSLSTFKSLSATTSAALSSTLRQAVDEGIFVVGSAGNENAYLNQVTDPFTGVTLVAATNRSGVKSSYSNYGAVAYSAPGGEWLTPTSDEGCILTTYPQSLVEMRSLSENIGLPAGYGPMCGTSLAAAHVTGVAAVIIGQLKQWKQCRPTIACVHKYLKKGCQRHEEAVSLGYGEVNAYAALEALARDRAGLQHQ